MLVLGCDPGLTGALSLIDSERGLLECADIPVCSNGLESGSMLNWVDVPGLHRLLANWSKTHDFARASVHAVIERPIAMPRLPAQTIASQFDTFGTIRAALYGRIGTVAYVSPHEWKSLFGCGNDKAKARACCLRLYPTAPVGRVKDHNRAESILIAHASMRRMA